VPFVIDHLGLPELPGSPAGLAELARLANCYLKVAGLARLRDEAEPPEAMWPLVRTALDEFGSSAMVKPGSLNATRNPYPEHLPSD
jgi:predicted TIM-barrel fold metal-dependent hydrolase